MTQFLPTLARFRVKDLPTCSLWRNCILHARVYFDVMLDKLDHKYKGNSYYNFFVVFVGLCFAAYMIMPDEWRKPTPLILVVFSSALIAKFSASNRNQK